MSFEEAEQYLKSLCKDLVDSTGFLGMVSSSAFLSKIASKDFGAILSSFDLANRIMEAFADAGYEVKRWLWWG
jgi:hypothetical protein